ncbi:MAG: glycosyltransferase, partial [Deltaproteobacteria bacterium]|nr:glycosyltransferase [Deltaproteobacteria bacterium]
MGRLSAQGKYIYQNGQKFFARGVSYGPFAPNSRGEPYPEPDRVAADFAIMSELGANLVRTYLTPPPWMFDLAAKYELRLMAGFYWPQHLAFLDSPEMVRDIRTTVRREITVLRQFKEVIFAYSIGNEIRSDVVRWHGPRAVSRFLAELYDIGKQLDPAGLFTYSNYPSAEYLDLSFLDVISFNVYLHREADFRRYLTHLMAITGERPLVLSETGIDTIREGDQHQAGLLEWQSRAALELGLSGLVIFAFTDEWFTGGNEITDWAFGITTRGRAPKPSFAAISRIFRGPLPPTLTEVPSASVIVPAYDAAPTIARCIESLKRLNYPDYEIMLVDDGSADSTAAIAESA